VPFLPKTASPPPNRSLDDAPMTPEVHAGWLSGLYWNWMTPLMVTGQ
jgi:hypothetical protein